MNFRKQLLCMLTYLAITTERALSYQSGCSGGYCFILFNDQYMTQDEALQRCHNNGGQLIEIQNQSIQTALTNFTRGLPPSYRSYYYLIVTNGRRQAFNAWTRLNGNNIGNITVNEEYDITCAYGYLKSTSSGFDVYAKGPADTRQGYICSGGQLDCTNGEGVLIDGQCYKSYSNEQLSWYDARNRCLDGGGDLASFDSITTNAGFKALNGSWINLSATYWIGFRKEKWIWATSSAEVRYSQWSRGSPISHIISGYFDQRDCICLSELDMYQWAACRCMGSYRFLCISGPSTASPSTTTTTTSTTATPTTATRTTSTTRTPTTKTTTTPTTRTPTTTTTNTATTSSVTSAASKATAHSTPGSSLSNWTAAPPMAQDQRSSSSSTSSTTTTTTPTTTTTKSTTSTVRSASSNSTAYSASGSRLSKGTGAPVAQDQRVSTNDIGIPVGVGVGVGAGIIVVAAIVVVIVLIKKCCPSRCLKFWRCCLRKEKPHDVILPSAAHEDHYWQVVKQSDLDNENHDANNASFQYRPVYARLEPLPNS